MNQKIPNPQKQIILSLLPFNCVGQNIYIMFKLSSKWLNGIFLYVDYWVYSRKSGSLRGKMRGETFNTYSRFMWENFVFSLWLFAAVTVLVKKGDFMA